MPIPLNLPHGERLSTLTPWMLTDHATASTRKLATRTAAPPRYSILTSALGTIMIPSPPVRNVVRTNFQTFLSQFLLSQRNLWGAIVDPRLDVVVCGGRSVNVRTTLVHTQIHFRSDAPQPIT